MDPKRWEEIERLYHLAREREGEERAKFLEKTCGGDEPLRREVESLLARPPEGQDFLEAPALHVAAMALAKDQVNAPPSDLTGRTIGHYRVLEKIGEGGMGVVYKARDAHLDRTVAIKVLPAEAMADPERKRRFVQEARAASALNHPGIVQIYDINSDGGVDFIVMEYVEGKTLDRRIGRKGLRIGEALKYGVQVADALAAAHAAWIVHRDLKPANIMVTETGLVKVLDFGLAKLTQPIQREASDTVSSMESLTGEGRIIGTVAYMSPEQAEGRPVDPRSDLFSFGSVLYEMVTGRRAFHGDTKVSTLSAILREEPQKASELVEGLPKEVEKIITRCLRKDPSRRFQHMDDVKVELEELKEESDSGRLLAPSASQTVRRRSLLWAVGLLVLLALGISVMWFVRPGSKHPQVELTPVPLTSYPGLEDRATFSRDGSQVAFMWNGEKQDNDDIYVKVIGQEGHIRLTTDPARDYDPAWAPDGSSIAFLRDLPGGRTAVCLVPPIGGAERKVTEASTVPGTTDSPYSSRCLTWSPDGNSLAVVSRNSSREPFGIFLFSIKTGERRKLTSPPTDAEGDYSPAFSPDGRALAFERFTASGVVLLAQQLSAGLTPKGEPTPILRQSQVPYNPTWTLDGRQIICAYGIGFVPSGLCRIAADGSGTRQRLEFAGEFTDSPSLSPQRNRLAYTRRIFDSNIWRIEIQGPRNQTSPAVKLVASTRNELCPQFSPDGRRIVFLSDRSGRPEIWVCNSDGSHSTQITSMGGAATGTPRWSQDGEHIVFDSSRTGNWDIFVVAAGGGEPRQLTNQPVSEAIPSWSHDGKWIYFCIQGGSPGGEPQVWKVPVEGGKVIQVTHKGGVVAFESRDGRFVYYTKSEDGTEGLWKMSVEGGEETQVIDRVVALRSFAIADLGIYFLTRSDARFNISFYRFATARTETMTKVESPTLSCLTVAPDGRSILCSQSDQLGGDLMLVENFR